ncbi:FKBP-type peptidyl-prolyl cis-trans isomerase [Marinagarivorans cellulosilyticus]|uniref:Peptidyl-prolyl cis-trans isomerase n=1 Tax=Marinagarivorans cellulosilyticus TaxID=2721545 RepID=A0AAN1WF46_9GAMM|nr:FKBP-type peptidyl-prolyl cis-trans isomerase [Marinagarivorans cellulosilyticus]BCD96442.1 FKBP-type peptidyl-prolyl cis-trans isomerase FklB [Marinagarivorans cellulosilyticus]
MSDYSTVEKKVSYGIGRQLGDQLLANPFDGMDIASVSAGLKDAFEGSEFAVAREDLDVAFKEISARIQAQRAEQSKELAAEGEAFLAENANKEGVTVLESGLQYEVITEGSGAKPSKTSTVRTHYHGTLTNGSVFDSSVERGEPAEFRVDGVIAGWTEALQLMPTGSKWRLFIPHNLAYGERGAGGAIGPYSALVFEVELIDIVA